MIKDEVLKLVLEYTEKTSKYLPTEFDAIGLKIHAAIREALAQPQEEPVGEAYLCDACDTPFDGAYYCPSPTCGHNTSTKQPIYTSPPARKPLTDEEIEQCMNQAYSTAQGRLLEHAFARAIEAAHGIKENT